MCWKIFLPTSCESHCQNRVVDQGKDFSIHLACVDGEIRLFYFCFFLSVHWLNNKKKSSMASLSAHSKYKLRWSISCNNMNCSKATSCPHTTMHILMDMLLFLCIKSQCRDGSHLCIENMKT